MATTMKSNVAICKKDVDKGNSISSKKAVSTYCYLASRDAAETRSAVDTIKRFIESKGK